MAFTFFEVQVQFNAADRTLSLTSPSLPGDPPPPVETISIAQGIGMIIFTMLPTLSATDGLRAEFPSNPVGWFNSTNPDQTALIWPQNFQVQWFDQNRFTLVDFNSALVRNEHAFNVIVAYGGQTYGADPTIINDPPIE